MKNYSIIGKYLLAIMMAAIMSVGFVSCSKDDDGKKGDEESIVGTWMETQESGTKLYLILLPNGYGSWVVEHNGRIDNDGEFTYTYNDNVITISYVDSNTVERLYVIGLTVDRLTIKYDDGGRKHVFYRN